MMKAHHVQCEKQPTQLLIMFVLAAALESTTTVSGAVSAHNAAFMNHIV